MLRLLRPFPDCQKENFFPPFISYSYKWREKWPFYPKRNIILNGCSSVTDVKDAFANLVFPDRFLQNSHEKRGFFFDLVSICQYVHHFRDLYIPDYVKVVHIFYKRPFSNANKSLSPSTTKAASWALCLRDDWCSVAHTNAAQNAFESA